MLFAEAVTDLFLPLDNSRIMRLLAIFTKKNLSLQIYPLSFFYPLLVLVLIGLFIIPSIKDYYNEIISFGLLSLLCYCITILLPARGLKKIIYLAAILGLSLFAFIKLSFYLHYDVKISASALFVIFETNNAEASDFLGNYFNSKVLGLFLLFLLPFIHLVRLVFFRRKETQFSRTPLLSAPKNNLIRVLLLLFIPLSIYAIQKNYRPNNILITSLGSYQDYLTTKENLKLSLAQKLSDNLTVTSTSETPQIHVIVIGESTTSWHLQLYGYGRETNPMLSEIKNELLVFDSVISPHVHTILSLEKVLTLSNFDDPDKVDNGSIVQLSNAAGFETYWISNQKPVGLHESIPTIVGSAADHTYFMATDDYQDHIYDEKILPTLDLVLKRKEKKKLIFIQLIGTHVAYKKRYPEKFEYFDNKEPLKYSDDNAKVTINEYDNAIRYNDFIVRSIIDKVKSADSKSTVLYFSDHGEDVFDVKDYAGHNEYHGTRPMYEVPFIVWLSEKYKAERPEILPSEELEQRRYSLEDFIHSFSDLCSIQFEGYDATRSIFSPNFIKRKRIIKDSINYDERQ